jgi:hypothetical protein
MKTLFALLIMCGVTTAQNFPDAPSHYRATQFQKHENVYLSPFKDPFFYAGTAFHASSVIADVHHSQQCQRERTCFEVNPGADKYRNRIPEIALVATADYGCSLMLSYHKRWRPLCMALPVAIGIFHWRDATHIYQVRR